MLVQYLGVAPIPLIGSRACLGFNAFYLKTNPDNVIGCIDIWRIGHPEHRGFWLGRTFWGQGIMTEAVYPINDFAFETFGYDKLVFANAVGNERSRRIKEKTGCKLVGLIPTEFVDPALTTSEIWELSKEEWILHKSNHKMSYKVILD